MKKYILEEQLKEYLQKEYYPLHMPGHKRRMAPAGGLPYRLDITEVPDMDDLHEAEGILEQAMERTATLFGAEQTWYLVNGSTCGNLAAIRAVAPYGSEIIVARNCHKSVCNAIEIGNLKVHWVYSQRDQEFEICGSVLPESIKEAIETYPESKAVFLTSPTYEGIISDLHAIAEICHKNDIPLIVDEAHGAHLSLFMSTGFDGGAIRSGADLVIQSPHKTLPSLTQTALLHGQGTLVNRREVERQLSIFETSSPSYPLMVSLDGCTGILREEGVELFQKWYERLMNFSEKVKELQYYKILCYGNDQKESHPTIWKMDQSKILIHISHMNMSGMQLAGLLRERFLIETEMSLGNNLLAMTSCCDDEQILNRLFEALRMLELEQTYVAESKADQSQVCSLEWWCGEYQTADLTIAEAMSKEGREIPLGDAEGEISGEYVWAYPPGVPLLVPGERITNHFINQCQMLHEKGTKLFHTKTMENRLWCVMK